MGAAGIIALRGAAFMDRQAHEGRAKDARPCRVLSPASGASSRTILVEQGDKLLQESPSDDFCAKQL